MDFINETDRMTRRKSGHCLRTLRAEKFSDYLHSNNNNNNNNNSVTVYFRAESTACELITGIATPVYNTGKCNLNREH